MLISELCRALKETADQAIANTRTAAELEVYLRKELLLGAQNRLAELEPAGGHGGLCLSQNITTKRRLESKSS